MANENVLNPEAMGLQNPPEDEAGASFPENAAQEIPPQESEKTAAEAMPAEEQDSGEITAEAAPKQPDVSEEGAEAVSAVAAADAPAADVPPEGSKSSADIGQEAAAASEQAEDSADHTEAGNSDSAQAEPDYFTVKPDETDSFADADEEIPIDFEAVEPESKKGGRLADTVQQVKNGFQEKYEEACSACKNLMDRLSNDLEQTNYNPYIRATTTYRYEILKKSSDTEPVDVFEFERTSGYSLRAMAITTVLVAAADVIVARLLKKKFF